MRAFSRTPARSSIDNESSSWKADIKPGIVFQSIFRDADDDVDIEPPAAAAAAAARCCSTHERAAHETFPIV